MIQSQPLHVDVDPYHSRVTGASHIVERVDPVIYKNNPGILSPEQLSFYEKNGYLVFNSLFSSQEMKHILSHVDELKSDAGKQELAYSVVEPHSRELRSLFHTHDYDSLLKSLACDQRILGIVEQIIGSQAYIHQSRINFKPGFKGRDFYWHSDFETWHMEDGMPRMRALSCSIALTENNEFNGPLMVIPASHKKYVVCAGDTPRDNYKQSLRQQYTGVPDEAILTNLIHEHGIISSKGSIGSVTFFDCNLMHGSNSNISPFPRSNIFFVYNSVENMLQKPYCGLEARPEYIAVRKPVPLTKRKINFNDI